VLAQTLPIFADEAYYYIWSLHPQLSYFDHPPMVSWLISLGRFFFPAGSALSLRAFFILGSFLTSLIWIFILKKKGASEKTTQAFLILTLLNPLLGPGSVVATPDVALVLFWSLSYLAFIGIFEEQNQKKLYFNYGLLGAALGLGFCAKYHIVLFVMSGVVFLLFNQTYKKIKPFGVALTLLFGLIFCSPVLIWNYQNDWSSFVYQLKHGFGKVNYDWHWTADFYLAQIALMSPLVFIDLFRKRPDKGHQIFSIWQVFFFTTSSFKAIVEANWPITSHLHSTANFTEFASAKKMRFTYGYWAFVYICMIVFFNLPVSKQALRNQYRSSQLDEVIPELQNYKPLYGPSYQIASLLTWKTQQFVPKLNGLSRFDFFDTLPESNPTEPKIFVLKHFDSIWPEKYDKYQKTKLKVFEDLKMELYQLSYE
jgi:4-amino-4-deoxy-L-arabinose transferase-like glycosyltransferase